MVKPINKEEKKVKRFSQNFMEHRFSNLKGLAVRSKPTITIKEGGKRE